MGRTVNRPWQTHAFRQPVWGMLTSEELASVPLRGTGATCSIYGFSAHHPPHSKAAGQLCPHPPQSRTESNETSREANVPLGTSTDSTSILALPSRTFCAEGTLWLLSPRTVGSVIEELSSNFINSIFF